MVKRNYGLNCFRKFDEEVFMYASEHNLTNIEFHLDKSHLNYKSLDNIKYAQLKEWAEKYNVQIGLHNPYNINASDIIPFFRKSDLKYLHRSLDIASQLNATHITLHVGLFYWFPMEKFTRRKALLRFIKSIEPIVVDCENNNICIALENVVPIPKGSEYYFLGDCCEDFEFLFSHLDSDSIKFCLDTGHANIGEGVLEYIRNFGDKLKVVHFHDNNGTNDEHIPVGEGNIDWFSITNELEKINFAGPFISETRKVKPHEAKEKLEKFFNNL